MIDAKHVPPTAANATTKARTSIAITCVRALIETSHIALYIAIYSPYGAKCSDSEFAEKNQVFTFAKTVENGPHRLRASSIMTEEIFQIRAGSVAKGEFQFEIHSSNRAHTYLHWHGDQNCGGQNEFGYALALASFA